MWTFERGTICGGSMHGTNCNEVAIWTCRDDWGRVISGFCDKCKQEMETWLKEKEATKAKPHSYGMRTGFIVHEAGSNPVGQYPYQTIRDEETKPGKPFGSWVLSEGWTVYAFIDDPLRLQAAGDNLQIIPVRMQFLEVYDPAHWSKEQTEEYVRKHLEQE